MAPTTTTTRKPMATAALTPPTILPASFGFADPLAAAPPVVLDAFAAVPLTALILPSSLISIGLLAWM